MSLLAVFNLLITEDQVRNYIIRRLLQLIPLLLIISFFIFITLSLTGNSLRALLTSNPRITAETITKLERIYGMDKPLVVRYLYWLKAFFTGEWGYSREYHDAVLVLIKARMPVTLALMGLSFLISVAVAIPIGVYSALKQYSLLDYAATALAFFGMAMPVFWFGLMLMLLFGVKLGWLPLGGYSSQGMDTANLLMRFLDHLKYLIMPAIVLGLQQMASWTRYTRSSMLEVLRMDYVRTARAKGLSERTVIYKHALRNALIPIITLLMLAIPGLFGGAVLTETVFSMSGIGRLLYTAITTSDTFLSMGTLMVLAILVVIFNFAADLLYAVADPRIKYS
jgi:peptide/nickel transport system permease protein